MDNRSPEYYNYEELWKSDILAALLKIGNELSLIAIFLLALLICIGIALWHFWG
jgi:hypothetical protein